MAESVLGEAERAVLEHLAGGPLRALVGGPGDARAGAHAGDSEPGELGDRRRPPPREDVDRADDLAGKACDRVAVGDAGDEGAVRARAEVGVRSADGLVEGAEAAQD